MVKSFVERVTGNLDEKRAWRQLMRRVDALPRDYRFTYKKILNYGYNYGFCCATQSDLLELFEENAAAGRPVPEVVGNDVAAFCHELMRAGNSLAERAGEALNREIREHFSKEANCHGKSN